jgi:hypothetical protein
MGEPVDSRSTGSSPLDHRQLFDLREGPHETRYLAAEAGHEPEIARPTALMRSWQEKLGTSSRLR